MGGFYIDKEIFNKRGNKMNLAFLKNVSKSKVKKTYHFELRPEYKENSFVEIEVHLGCKDIVMWNRYNNVIIKDNLNSKDDLKIKKQVEDLLNRINYSWNNNNNNNLQNISENDPKYENCEHEKMLLLNSYCCKYCGMPM